MDRQAERVKDLQRPNAKDDAAGPGDPQNVFLSWLKLFHRGFAIPWHEPGRVSSAKPEPRSVSLAGGPGGRGHIEDALVPGW